MKTFIQFKTTTRTAILTQSQKLKSSQSKTKKSRQWHYTFQILKRSNIRISPFLSHKNTRFQVKKIYKIIKFTTPPDCTKWTLSLDFTCAFDCVNVYGYYCVCLLYCVLGCYHGNLYT